MCRRIGINALNIKQKDPSLHSSAIYAATRNPQEFETTLSPLPLYFYPAAKKMDFESSNMAYWSASSERSELSDVDSDIEMADVSVPSLHLDAFRLVERTCKDFVDLTEGELLPDDVQRHLEKAVDGLKALSNSKAPIVGVLGNTGAGKSTLICSILKWMGLPRSSQVRIPTCLLAVLNPVSVLTSIRGAQSI